MIPIYFSPSHTVILSHFSPSVGADLTINSNSGRNFNIKSSTASKWFPVKDIIDEDGTKESKLINPEDHRPLSLNFVSSNPNPNPNLTVTDMPRQEMSTYSPIRLGDSTCGKDTDLMMKPPSTNSSEISTLSGTWNDARTLSGATTAESRTVEYGGRNFTDSTLLRVKNPAADATLPSPLSLPAEERKPILGGHDVRVKLTTTKMLSKGDDLYDTACPDGSPPIIVDQRTGRPSPSVYTKAAQRVASAKKLIEYKVFQLDQTVSRHVHGRDASSSISAPPATVVATSPSPPIATRRTAASSPEDPFGDRNLKKISEGGGTKNSCRSNESSSSSNNNDNNINNDTNTTKIVSNEENEMKLKVTAILSKYQHFGGEALEEAESLVDLALEVDCSPLITYLQIGTGDSKQSMKSAISKWLGQALEHVLRLSESIEVENTLASNLISNSKK